MSFFLIDKPAGITSNDVIRVIKKQEGLKKVGHSGTLDPFATGLLILASDHDTKFLDMFLNEKKTYTGIIQFGKTTDTLDTEGTVIDELEDFELKIDKVRSVIDEYFTGMIEQTPPNYSAIKVDGKRAYELSREGKEVQLKPVKRIIYSFKVFEDTETSLGFEVEVSSGTYIRALARDIGEKLEIPAMLSKLRRTSVGMHNIEDSSKIEKAQPIKNSDFLFYLKFQTVSKEILKSILEGKVVKIKNVNEQTLLIRDEEETTLILIEKLDLNKYKIKKRIH